MTYYTSEDPVVYIPDPMNIEWEEENNNEADGCPKDDIKPTSTSTIQVTSMSMDEESIPNNCIVSLTEPHTNGPPKEVQDTRLSKGFSITLHPSSRL